KIGRRSPRLGGQNCTPKHSDFPQLLTGAGNRVLTNAYQAAQSPLKALARQRTASDFRALTVLKLGEFSGLQKLSEHGEIRAMTTGEAKEGYALETFGGTFALSRKAITNDDLGAFARWGEMMGRAAAETESKQLLALLAQNGGAGIKMDDGKTLFHADHGNLAATGAALSEAALSAARLALRTQKGLDGKTPVNVVPKYLVVAPALETAAEKLLAAINATTAADVNPFGGKLSLLVEPRLTGNGWFVFGDPATAPVLEYAYLSSAPGPQLSSRDGWEVLGREFRVVLDFGCGAVGLARRLSQRGGMMLADLIQFRDRLRAARYGGVRRLRDQNGEEVEYKTDTEMARALAALDAEIQGLARRPTSIIRFQTSKGV
uniref:phage head-tail joining protein n=1 Tax=Cereibacter sediminicola TaxID=2584941 RepID=UPI001C930852